MTYYQFIHAVEEKIKKEVKEERKISVHTNIKNNGVKRTGIMISENGINISPTIYLEEYFQQFKRGYPLELIVKDILSLYEKIRFQNSWKEGEKVKSYDFVKESYIVWLTGNGIGSFLRMSRIRNILILPSCIMCCWRWMNMEWPLCW